MLHSEYRFVLGSQSPRRKELLSHIIGEFSTFVMDVDESFPADMAPDQVAEYLAIKKAGSIWHHMGAGDILLTADSIVICDNFILNKPKDYKEAFEMLSLISDNTHEVHTGFCMTTTQKKFSGVSKAKVSFGPLSDSTIDHYIRQFKPFDKAGSYGIQEWIGYIGVKEIEGTFANIMGLPVYDIYKVLVEEFGFREA